MMACDEQWRKASFLQEDDEQDDHHRVQYSFSRLSVCSNYGEEDDEDDDGDNTDNDDEYSGAAAISRLSVEETGEDADEEPSDSEKIRGGERLLDLDYSDSDKESGFQSLPVTPPRRRRRNLFASGGGGGGVVDSPVSDGKAYASENEAEKGRKSKSRGRRKSRVKREYPRWMGGGHGGGGVVVLTKAIGGGKPLCMDMEEVKACKELGFELEPGRVSYSAGSTLDTSSGGNSPISSWRISSPG